MPDSNDFYSELPLHKTSLSKLLGQAAAFQEVPDDWCVVITDIKNSTAAVQAGQHQLVNLVATGSIISAINMAKNKGIQIPFFFGGDGATILVPNELKEDVLQALTEHKENTLANFKMDLRVGCLDVSELYKQGKELKICKVALEKGFDIPLVLGEGLRFAEDIIKADSFQANLPAVSRPVLDLEGMECRWDKIEPPEKRLEVVCLLIDALEESTQRVVFQKVMTKIEEIYGPLPMRRPLSVQQLHLKVSWERIADEAKVKFGHRAYFYVLLNWMLTGLGRIYFALYSRGREYLQELVEWSDTLVIDGRINTVISGTAQQRAELLEVLDELEKKEELLYGYYISPETIMSCYVRRKEKQHIHFVDGSEGGYTKAAGVLKEKWSAIS